MTYSHIPDTREGWAAGAPEIEYHIRGARYASDWQAGDLACSGESESGYRRFNQDHLDYSGTVLLFTRTQMEEQQINRGESTNYITVWEDDDDRCTIKSDDQKAFLWAIGSYLGANATNGIVKGDLGCDACGVYLTRTHLAMTLTFLYNALKEDEIIGLVIRKGTDPEFSHIPTDWVILGENAQSITGYAEIVTY